MLMKVFNKGQVVIPAAMRKRLGIDVGDMLDVTLDEEGYRIELKKTESATPAIAGSLAEYAKGKSFPSRTRMREALAKGMRRER